MGSKVDDLVWQLNASGWPPPLLEYRFHPSRRWRFDLCWPKLKLAVEVEGGVWSGGRHVTGAGYEKDLEKYNAGTNMGFRILRFSSGMVEDGRALGVIEDALREAA